MATYLTLLSSLATGRAEKRVRRWLLANANQFAIIPNEGTNAVKGNAVPWRIKPLSELMFLLIVLGRHGVILKGSQALVDLALSEARSFDWHELAAYDPAAASPTALVAEFFEFHDEKLPYEVEYLDQLRSGGFFEGIDRLPYRDMDVAYAHSRTGDPSQSNQLPALFQETCFGREQPIARYSITDIYALTHSLFYLTDVGLRPIEQVLDDVMKARLREDLISLTVAMLRHDNLDVLGELLICWMMCGFSAENAELAIFDAARMRLIAGVAADGAVPPTRLARHRYEKGEIGFVDVYHTTLVAMICLSLLGKRR